MPRPTFFTKIRHAKTAILIDKLSAEELNTPDNLGRTILHWLPVWTDETSNWKIEAIIKRGANVNAKDASGVKPLDLAVFNGNVDLVKILLENGAKPDAITVEYLNDHRDEMIKLLLGVN
jgi:ankyrin repeat protein